MAQQDGMEDSCIMKHCSLIAYVVIAVGVFCISCSSLKRECNVIEYPTAIKEKNEIAKKIQDVAPIYYSVIDVSGMKVYSLGDYYLMQSTLCGPSGRASNYYHYLIMDSAYSKQVYFMSLSAKINNLWIDRGILFVDLLDFIDEAYYNDEYSNCSKCGFVIYRMKLSKSSFVLDTITEEKVELGLEDLMTYSRH